MSGRLVRRMTPALTNERNGAGVPSPRQGSRVRLWQLDGLWAVWCDGPGRTRWLNAADDEARDVLATLGAEPGSGAPVVENVFAGKSGATSILVKCSAIRAAVRLRGEA